MTLCGVCVEREWSGLRRASLIAEKNKTELAAATSDELAAIKFCLLLSYRKKHMKRAKYIWGSRKKKNMYEPKHVWRARIEMCKDSAFGKHVTMVCVRNYVGLGGAHVGQFFFSIGGIIFVFDSCAFCGCKIYSQERGSNICRKSSCKCL